MAAAVLKKKAGFCIFQDKSSLPVLLMKVSRSSSKHTELQTIKTVRDNLKKLVGAQLIWSDQPNDRSGLSDKLVHDQSQLPQQRMIDSYREAIIPLGTDVQLREHYVTFVRTTRFGRILQDLDTFAVHIGYAHNVNPAYGSVSPVSIVTALVDRIDLHQKNLAVDRDIKLSGNATWVGKSSMEVTMHLDQEREPGSSTWDRMLNAKFLMVARDPVNKGAALFNKLIPENKEEERIFQAGEASKIQRQQQCKYSLLHTPPNEEESLLIYNTFRNTLDASAATFKIRVKPENSVWMEEGLLKTIIICHPEQRNLYGKIFGGFLMQSAFELAWANAYTYCKSRPLILAVDDIMFMRPVEVGSLLFLSSQVVYTSGPFLQVKVHAETVHALTGQHETLTNMFHFTFRQGDGNDVPKVVPKTYAESMMYIDGKRHFDESLAINKQMSNDESVKI